VVLPHWNAHATQHNSLCAGLAKLGISTLRLSLPYHDYRMPAELQRADYAVSSNVARTIDATRQAVIDTRGCVDWLEQQGYESIGVVGTAAGFGLGLLITKNLEAIRQFLQHMLHVDLFSAEIYFFTRIPARIDAGEVTTVVIMALALSFLATLYPSWRAARLDPVEALRYE